MQPELITNSHEFPDMEGEKKRCFTGGPHKILVVQKTIPAGSAVRRDIIPKHATFRINDRKFVGNVGKGIIKETSVLTLESYSVRIA